MGCAYVEIKKDPCPNCGKPEGACMGSTRWGHDHYCCSDECGMAFASSPERWEMEVEKSEHALRDAALHLASCERNLARAMEHESERTDD